MTAGRLCLQYLPPGQHPLHQGVQAQFCGDGQLLVLQGHCLLAVARVGMLEQGVGVVEDAGLCFNAVWLAYPASR